ncbi:hypothetical protein GCM10028808_72500 [Spirosoma migulaei]
MSKHFIFFRCRSTLLSGHFKNGTQRLGLCTGYGIEFHLPGTTTVLNYKYKRGWIVSAETEANSEQKNDYEATLGANSRLHIVLPLQVY